MSTKTTSTSVLMERLKTEQPAVLDELTKLSRETGAGLRGLVRRLFVEVVSVDEIDRYAQTTLSNPPSNSRARVRQSDAAEGGRE